MNDPRAAEIWRNGKIPVLYDRGGDHPLLLRVPAREDNETYLRGKRGRKIYWNADIFAWSIPARSRFDDLVRLCLARWGAVYIIQVYREMIKCAPACWDAKGFVCVCSCGGGNHGSGQALAHVVSDTFAFEWSERKLSCRLIRVRTPESLKEETTHA